MIEPYNSEGEPAIYLTPQMALKAKCDAMCEKLRTESLVQSKLCRMQRYLDRHRAELRFRGKSPERMMRNYRKFLNWQYRVKS